MKYVPELDIRKFGRRLIETQDLDPVYVALARAGMDPVQLRRWLLAYWCFYDCGTATYISRFEGLDFFEAMEVAALNVELSPIGERWRRGSERRHFRGRQALVAVAKLREGYGSSPESVADSFVGTTCERVMRQVQSVHGFGKWIAFKVADMLERVLGHEVSFDEASVLMWESPQQAATMMALQENVTVAGHPAQWAIAELTREFSDLSAPPTWVRPRPVGLQEVETVLCKWKSHVRGHYPHGCDIREIRHHLAPWARVDPAARNLLEAMPCEPSS